MPFLQFLRENAQFLGAGALLTFASSFGQTFFISIFAGDIRATFGLGHGSWGAIYGLATAASAVAMVWAGVLTDRYRVRVLGAVVLCGLAASCLLMALTPNVAVLCIAIFALRFFGQGMAGHTALVAMARWFVATRGKAISIATGGFALGEAILPLSFVALLGVLPWRMLWVLAAILAVAALPVVVRLLALERTPQALAAGTQSAGMDGRHWTRREVLSQRLFWLTLPAQIAVPCFGTAFFFQQVHLAAVKGWEHVQLVALFPLYTAVAVAASLSVGWAIDRVGTARLIPLYLLPMGVGFAVLGVVQTITGAAVSMSLMGVTHGAGGDARRRIGPARGVLGRVLRHAQRRRDPRGGGGGHGVRLGHRSGAYGGADRRGLELSGADTADRRILRVLSHPRHPSRAAGPAPTAGSDYGSLTRQGVPPPGHAIGAKRCDMGGT